MTASEYRITWEKLHNPKFPAPFLWTRTLVDRLLSDYIEYSRQAVVITLDDVVREVEKGLNVTLDDMKKPQNTKHKWARRVYFVAARTLTPCTLKEIGEKVGKRFDLTHSAIHYAARTEKTRYYIGQVNLPIPKDYESVIMSKTHFGKRQAKQAI